jgi:hypothetical protein
MATRIGVMHAGRLAQIGTPAEVYERPNSRFVAEFLGAANVLPAIARASGRHLELTGLNVAVCAAETAPVGPLLLAVRPERVRLGEAGLPNSVQGVVVDCAYGGETLTHSVRLADGSLMRSTRSLHDGLGGGIAGIGDTVTLSWSPDACILLPPWRPAATWCSLCRGRGSACPWWCHARSFWRLRWPNRWTRSRRSAWRTRDLIIWCWSRPTRCIARRSC